MISLVTVIASTGNASLDVELYTFSLHSTRHTVSQHLVDQKEESAYRHPSFFLFLITHPQFELALYMKCFLRCLRWIEAPFSAQQLKISTISCPRITLMHSSGWWQP
jgi:hypothetical protein